MASEDRPVNILDFGAWKKQGRKITSLTAYDFPTAHWLDAAGVDCLLVANIKRIGAAADLRCHSLRLGEIAIDNHDSSVPAGGKLARASRADAAGAAGHDINAFGLRSIHECRPFELSRRD